MTIIVWVRRTWLNEQKGEEKKKGKPLVTQGGGKKGGFTLAPAFGDKRFALGLYDIIPE